MASLPYNTFASPGNSFYALKGEVGNVAEWYTYPSQNGEIQLIDASGTQTLRSIDGNLFYNNELLAKANDLQNIADWSLYPAIATVELAGQNITQVNDLSASTVHIGTGTFNTVNSSAVSSATVAASGLVSGGSMSATNNIQGGSLTTTGGLDMTNSAITRASSVGISAGGFAPYGSLSSPDGVMLTWNGSAIQTGGAGNVAQWANYAAVTNINANGYELQNAAKITATQGNIGTMTMTNNNIVGDASNAVNISSGSNQSLNLNATNNATITSTSGAVTLTSTTSNILESTPSGSITRNAYNSINDNCGTSYNLTVDRFLTPLGAPLNLTAQNGLGGNIQLLAKQSATIPGQGSIGYGQIGLTALGSTNAEFGLGGKIDITAYSGGVGEYGGATSRVSLSAATLALSAGAAPPLPGLAGSMNIFGNGAVSIVADLVPPVLPQIPETVYIFGRGAIRLETGSAFGVDGGVQMLSDTYAGNIYPISDSDLVLQGRSAPDGYVKIMDCNQFEMTSGAIAKIDTIQVAAGGTTNPVTIDNLTGNLIAADTTNLTITGKANLIGSDYFVNIAKANSVAFDAAGVGAITGVQSINGAAWPPPTGDAALWSQYPATSTIDASGYGITNLTSINGVPYVASDTEQWATYPAVQSVDISSNGILNVNDLHFIDNGYIVSAGALSIASDLSGDLSLAAAGGGNVNIGAGNLGNINIVAGGHTLTLGAEIVSITGNGTTITDPSGIVLATPTVNVSNGNIINVTDIDGVAGTPLTLNSSSDIALEAANDAYVEAQAGSANLNGNIDVNLDANTGAVNITGATGIQLNSATTIGTVGTNRNLTVNGTVDATGDVISSFGGSSPYSLNTIGALVTTPQTYNYWVAVNGSNTTGTGSVTNPFSSITAALAATAALADGIPVNINVTAGTYTENPTITRNNTFIIGTPTVSDVVIVGTLSLTPAVSAQPLITQGGSGITVVGNVVCSETVNTEVNWYMANVNVTSYGVAALSCTGDVSNNCSITLNNCVITQNTTNSAAIQLVSCRANLVLVSVAQNTTSPALSLFLGNSSVAANGATFTCAGTALASPVVFINNTISAGSLNTFTSCSFIYTAATAGSAKTAVQFNNAVAANAVFNYCVFSVGGSTNIISKTGIGSTNINWGHNTCTSVSTVPATSATLTYSYSAQDFIRANTLRDSANSAGTANQVLTAGTGGGSLNWSSLTTSSLGTFVPVTSPAAYRNQLVYYDTSSQALSYSSSLYSTTVTTGAGSTISLFGTNRGKTYIFTGAAGTITFNTAGLTASDAGFFIYIKNGNPPAAVPINFTLAGVTGVTTLYGGSTVSFTTGQMAVLYWNGTAMIAY